MAGTVWNRIDNELAARKAAKRVPSTWAELARAIEATDQVVSNWGQPGRQVPPGRYPAIARALGWTVEQLLGEEAAPRTAPATAAPADFGEQAAQLIRAFSLIPAGRRIELLTFADTLMEERRTTAVPPTEEKRKSQFTYEGQISADFTQKSSAQQRKGTRK